MEPSIRSRADKYEHQIEERMAMGQGALARNRPKLALLDAGHAELAKDSVRVDGGSVGGADPS